MLSVNTMEDVISRLAEVEKKVSGERFRKTCSISTDVALTRLASAEKDQTARLEYILQKAKLQMIDTISKNGRASKGQRDEVKDTVSNLDGRLVKHGAVLSEMEAGL